MDGHDEHELIRRRSEYIVLPEFCRDIAALVREYEKAKTPADFVLVTYNRIGEGQLAPESRRGDDIRLLTYQGRLTHEVSHTEMLDAILGGVASDPRLPLDQVKDFYQQVGQELAKRIMASNRPMHIVIYGGEDEKLVSAIEMIKKLVFVAGMAGKQDLVKLYLLTCPHGGVVKKTEGARPFLENGQLKQVVYSSECNAGMKDLQAIADAVLGDAK